MREKRKLGFLLSLIRRQTKLSSEGGGWRFPVGFELHSELSFAPLQHMNLAPSLRLLAAAALCSALLPSCATSLSSAQYGQAMAARSAQIAAEPRGDYYIGRRFYIERTHLWGYLRRPGESWDRARLVIMNERAQRVPDRLPESPSGTGLAHGYDHNREYRIQGRYTGKKVYDPNSNLILPEFELQRAAEMNSSPGWLFHPAERFNGNQLLRGEPDAMPR
jgi:hypothetical protein